MSVELGRRLVEAAIVPIGTVESAFTSTDSIGPISGGALVERLVSLGAVEDNIVEWFVSDGFGPVVRPEVMSLADITLVQTLSAEMARNLMCLPIRRLRDDVVVAMADPSDRHALEELRRVLRHRVISRVARVSSLRRFIDKWYPITEPVDLEENTYPGVAPQPLMHDTARHDARRYAAPGSPGTLTHAQAFQNVQAAQNVAPHPQRQAPQPKAEVMQKVFNGRARSVAEMRRSAGEPWDDVKREGPSRQATSLYATPNATPESPVQKTYGGPASRPATARLSRHPQIPVTLDSVLYEMKEARDAQQIMHLGCRGVLTFARNAVAFRYRDWIFHGWWAEGPDVSSESIGNVRIPTGTESNFRSVVVKSAPYQGPHGSTPADALFRIATRSHARWIAIHPIFVGKKLVAALCGDDVPTGDATQQPMDRLAKAIQQNLERLIQEKKAK